jgi:CheY-like chemotaxis protein
MPTILLIDDDDAFRELARRMLVTAGYDVREAADGMAAIESYRQQRSDVVITDILMPEREGLETIQELRRLDPQVRIIAMSGAGFGRDAYLELARRFGARRILRKAFTLDDLRAAVAEVLAT